MPIPVKSKRSQFKDRKYWRNSRSKEGNIWRWVDLPDNTRERLVVYQDDGRFYGIYLHGYSYPTRFYEQEDAIDAAYEFVEDLFEEAPNSEWG